MSSLLDLLAGLKDKAVDAGSNLAQAASDQWDKGSPYRIAAGALLSGDPQTAGDVLNQHFANTTPDDINSAALNTGLGFAPVGMIGEFRANPAIRDAFQSTQDSIRNIQGVTKEHYDVASDLFNRGFRVGTDGQIHRPTSSGW